MNRIGIFSGSFDPVHAGHVAFALQALKSAKLDKVYFSPESGPRRKEGVTHIAHRVAMLELASQAHPRLGVLELVDRRFSVAQTLPRLRQKFPGDELFYLCGSDMLEHMPEWSLIKVFRANMGLVIGARSDSSAERIDELLSKLPSAAKKTYIIASELPAVSSRQIRESISAHKPTDGLLASTRNYINKNWLYSTPPQQ